MLFEFFYNIIFRLNVFFKIMKNGKRALAHIERISWIKPVNGADKIELVGVLGWQCIAKKGEFKVGDLCVYIEIDSRVPETEEFEFLRNKGFKIKTMKLNKFKDDYGNGIISQGIAIPIGTFDAFNGGIPEVGNDVTDVLGVTYHDPEDAKRKKEVSDDDAKFRSMMDRKKKVFSKKWVKRMMKYKWFRSIMFLIFGKKKDKPLQFPDYIKKTDEERIENLPWLLEDNNTVYVMTEKIDGTSTTFGLRRIKRKKFDFAVCSRNVRQLTPTQPCFVGDNVYWQMAVKYNIEEKLHTIYDMYTLKGYSIDSIVLQGETYGKNLQGNPYNMATVDFKAFNLIIKGRDENGNQVDKRLNPYELQKHLDKLNIPCVPILGDFTFPKGITMPEFKEMATGKSVLGNMLREGIVYRGIDDAWQSFKNVSNDYLLKH